MTYHDDALKAMIFILFLAMDEMKQAGCGPIDEYADQHFRVVERLISELQEGSLPVYFGEFLAELPCPSCRPYGYCGCHEASE